MKQEEGVDLYRALTATTFKRLYMCQAGHSTPGAETGSRCSTASSTTRSLGVDNGVDSRAARAHRGPHRDEKSTGFRTETAWPPAGTPRAAVPDADGALGARRPGHDSFRDLATSTEEQSTRMPGAETNWLFFQGAPLARGHPHDRLRRLELTLEVDRDHAHLTPLLVDVAPDGTTKTVSRGFLNLLYRNGLASAQAVPAGEPIRAPSRPSSRRTRSSSAGHRIGVIVQGSNTVWAVPDDPGRRLHARPRPVELTLPLMP